MYGESNIPCPSCSRGFGWPLLRHTGNVVVRITVDTGDTETMVSAVPKYICPACRTKYYERDGKITDDPGTGRSAWHKKADPVEIWAAPGA